jgi:uncharacterized membrane protein
MALVKLNEMVAVLCCGLLAGVFFAFETAINPTLHRLPDSSYLTTMQQINRVIQNPAFLLIFLAPVLLLTLSTWLHWGKSSFVYGWLGAAGLYLVAVFGVTVFCNVPLNELLDKIDLNQASALDLQSLRERYEMPWNRWHTLRTWAAVLAFLLAILALVLNKTSSAS